MKLNKLLAMSAVVACGLTLASCGGSKEVTVGIGYSGSFSESYGNMQLDLSAAMVSFEADGTIVDARIDVVQVKVGANEAKDGLELKNTNVVDGSVTTKLELGKDYNMKGSSAIGVEVDSQIEAFADWVVGKKYNEIASSLIPGSGHGIAPHADLASTCTITVDAFVAAIESAWANRSSSAYTVSKDAKIGIAMKSGLAYNYGNPTKEISIDVAGTVVEGGKVVASAIDAIVYPVAIAEDGTMSTDTSSKYIENGLVVSKKALGDKYAMKPASPVGKEWYEQAAIIEAAAIGKTSAEIAALVKNEGDLVGATMTLDSYTAMLAKSATYAEKELIGPQA